MHDHNFDQRLVKVHNKGRIPIQNGSVHADDSSTGRKFYADLHSIGGPPDEIASPSEKSAIIEGDIMIGGLFPVHKKNVNPLLSCGEIQGDRGIQRLEAMLYAINKVNEDDTILPGVRLGANIMDTCSRDTYALEQALEYVRASMTSLETPRYECNDGSQAQVVGVSPKEAVMGVIGGSYSTVSIQVGGGLLLFKSMQISVYKNVVIIYV